MTQDEYNRLICLFSSRATDLRGHRNLVIILLLLLLGTLGLRTFALLALYSRRPVLVGVKVSS